jgi:uncharacterized protein (DUF2126 family)/transglutaminase-like putative cysteine protease
VGIKVALNHVTHYSYDQPTRLGPQVIRLRPAPHARTPIQAYSLNIAPEDHFLNWQQDPFGNWLARAVLPEKTKTFRVEVDLVAEIRIFNPFDFFLEDYAKEFPFKYEASLAEELAPYLVIKESGPLLMEYLTTLNKDPQPQVDFLSGINQKLNHDLGYLIRMEPGVQTCEKTLETKSGSCRDMAWLQCQMLRHLGLATRFASGYLIQLKADVKSLDGPSGTEVDFTDLHAWTEVYLPGAGWVGLDATSGLFAGESHIPLCCTPNPSSAAPISGIIEGSAKSELKHTMTVTRIQEERRITKPYSEEEWGDIDQLGKEVDQALTKQDVRLTMGGEPTFVSHDDKEAAEWNTEAMGPQKWDRAKELLVSLGEYFGPEGLLHYGQGKWYPGELLPRWALSCIWRNDKQPIWKDQKLIALEPQPKKATLDQAHQFIKELSQSLGVNPSMAMGAREDAPYYLWKEGRLPLEGDILKADLYEKTERLRLQALLEKDISKDVGYVLPLAYSHKRKRWITNRWKFRSDHLVLSIGNSPLGLRLPMGSLPYVKESLEEIQPEKSPYAKLEILPEWDGIVKGIGTRYEDYSMEDDTYLESDPNGFVRTAMCVEPRDGYINVFLPPTTYLENFLDLIASIEWTANKLQLPVRIEGYGPPNDLRIKSLKLTPDPGVLEVNVQPVGSWDEQVEVTNVVYEKARLARLATDKFLLDGRRIGTGGGNHIVVGGATPADSPFLRKPDLVRSMITFWQHHPSLSYFFSSLFIGPTSQSPRVDEARHESLYELEIAFSKIEPGKDVPNWLVDRLLRNLLIDVTGNTHRAEFCIDKLYNPEGETGRLGLLELRNFDMPPHPRMSLVQSLLVRACIASFWKTPYHGPLERWGTQLQDKFMLPHFVWNDFGLVLRELSKNGFHFKHEWFLPLFEFRFPLAGSLQIGDVTIEVRTALEPWPVMGEESNSGAMSRGVDSSVERLQVKVTGLDHTQQTVTCNGHEIPLHTTDTAGCRVGGVRFKAWAPTSCLHPTIDIHAPLVFDLVDRRYGRSLGGCTYHVAHPGGRNYDSIPVNENEAEGRRLSRFDPLGHTPGTMKIGPLEPNQDFPLTLDLRTKPVL